jgi:hypothetical protein
LILPLTGCTVIAVADTVGAVAVKTVGAVAGATVDVASAGAGWVFGSDDKEDDD